MSDRCTFWVEPTVIGWRWGFTYGPLAGETGWAWTKSGAKLAARGRAKMVEAQSAPKEERIEQASWSGAGSKLH